MINIEHIGQGNAVIADAEAVNKDTDGFTNPNLHRRTYTPAINTEYSFGIYGLNSFRTTEFVTHDEESTTSEIP